MESLPGVASPYATLPPHARRVVALIAEDPVTFSALPWQWQRELGRLRSELDRRADECVRPTVEVLALADMIERGAQHAGYVDIQISVIARDELVDHLRYPREPSADVTRLALERDEADRRAGAAERQLEECRESLFLSKCAISQRKREAGYPDAVSFDDVWSQTLAKAYDAQQQEGK